jgi:hypothetical protein
VAAASVVVVASSRSDVGLLMESGRVLVAVVFGVEKACVVVLVVATAAKTQAADNIRVGVERRENDTIMYVCLFGRQWNCWIFRFLAGRQQATGRVGWSLLLMVAKIG